MATQRRLTLDDLLFAGPVRPAGPGGHFARHSDWKGRIVLDHGCGDARFRGPVQALGAKYIGLDPFAPNADLVASGEAIPLDDASVDIVISHAVLHLVPHPARDMAEIARVLRPGGRLLGYVAFLESFQESSMFHVSHRGLEILCRDAGLSLEEIRPTATGLDYQAAEVLLPMGLLAPVRRIVRGLVRASTHLAFEAWSAAFAARRCAREGDWSRWNELRFRWRWYFSLSQASGFEFVASKLATAP